MDSQYYFMDILYDFRLCGLKNHGKVNMTGRLDNKEVGNRIQSLRKCKGISQETLAAELDVSTRHVASIEAGERGLTVENAFVIADYFGTSLDYLYRGKTLSLGMEPICQMVHDTMSKLRLHEMDSEYYKKNITDISDYMRSK